MVPTKTPRKRVSSFGNPWFLAGACQKRLTFFTHPHWWTRQPSGLDYLPKNEWVHLIMFPRNRHKRRGSKELSCPRSRPSWSSEDASRPAKSARKSLALLKEIGASTQSLPASRTITASGRAQPKAAPPVRCTKWSQAAVCSYQEACQEISSQGEEEEPLRL